MSQELIYTSMPRGLRPGSNGFCTVAMTSRMPDALVERLESLSGYRPVYQLGDPQADRNPVNFAHWRVAMRDRQCSVLSRVAFAGADYSQRSNKFAHHIVVEPGEQPAAGPAWVLSQPGLMESTWPGEPRMLEKGRPIPSGDRSAMRCTAWESVVGDAGWAGVLADAFRNNPTKPVYIVYAPGTEVLPLIEEALALLTVKERWQVTFSTYFTDLPMGATCMWRCVVTGSAAEKDALRSGVKPFPIDLTKPLPPAPDTPLTEAARSGRAVFDSIAKGPAASGEALSSPTLSFKGDPFGGEEQAAIGRHVAVTSRKPLSSIVAKVARSSAGAPDAVEEYDDAPQSLTDLDLFRDGSGMRGKVIVRRVVPAWGAALLCVFFLAAGGSAGWAIRHEVLLAKIEQLNDKALKDEQKRDENERKVEDELKVDVRKAKEEASAAKASQNDINGKLEQMTNERNALGDSLKTADAKATTADNAKAVAEAAAKKASDAANAAQAELGTVKAEFAKLKNSAQAATSDAGMPPAANSILGITAFDLKGPIPSPTDTDPRKLTAEWPVNNIQAILPLFPNGLPELELEASKKIKLEQRDGRFALMLYVSRPASGITVEGSAATPEPKELASFALAGDKLKFGWIQQSYINQPKVAMDIMKILELTTIIGIKDGKQIALYRIPSVNEKTKVQAQFGVKNQCEPLEVPTTVSNFVVAIVQPAGAWQRTNKTTLERQFNNEKLDAAFSIKSATSEAVTVTTNWNEHNYTTQFKPSLEGRKNYNELQQEIDAQSQKIGNLDTQINGEKRHDELQKLRKERGEHEEKKNQVSSILSRAREAAARIRAYEEIGPVVVDVALPNGLVLYHVNFMPPVKWTDDQ